MRLNSVWIWMASMLGLCLTTGWCQCPRPAQYYKCAAGEAPGQWRAPGTVVKIQPRFSDTQSAPGQPSWGLRDDGDATDDYNTRRIRIAHTRQFADDWLGFAQVRRDWGMSDFKLLDLYATYSGWEHANITLGEMIVPFERLIPTSDPTLPLAERPMPVRLLTPFRDIGVLLHNTTDCDQRLGWYAGAFLGDGLNETNKGGSFMLAARAEYLVNDSLNVGAFWCGNDRANNSLYQRFLKKNNRAYGVQANYDVRGVDEESWGVDALYRKNGTSVFAGYIAKEAGFAGGSIDADGWYVHGGHALEGVADGRLQLVAGYEEIDPNDAVVDQLDARWTTLGANYQIDGSKKQIRLNYVIRDERVGEVNNNTWLLEYDYMFNMPR